MKPLVKIIWLPEASKTYLELMDRDPKSKTGLPLFQREQLALRIDALRSWPPSKWFDLRKQRDGIISFQLDTEQFADVLGIYENDMVKITHVEIRKKDKRRNKNA